MNPARELADLLTEWQTLTNGVNVYEQRGGTGGNIDDAGWRLHVRAIELWRLVDQTLASLEAAGRKVDHYRRWEETWLRGIMVPDRHWGQSSNGIEPLINNQGAIDALFGLADIIDIDSSRLVSRPEDRVRSRAALDELYEMLESDALALDESGKRYFFHLIDATRTLLDEATAYGGEVDMRARIFELMGALSELADSLETADMAPLAKKLHEIRRRVAPWLVNGAGWVVAAIATAADVKELGS